MRYQILIVFLSLLSASELIAKDEVPKLCFECHTADNNNPDPTIPKIIGQNKTYLLREMQAFKSGYRYDPLMTDVAINLTNEKQLTEIIDFFASQPLMKGTPSDSPLINKGKEIYTTKHCDFCHGIKGKLSNTYINGAPVIGGQNSEYLYKTMVDLRYDKRPSDPFGLMRKSLLSLSSEDFEALAAYLAIQ